MQKAGPSHGLLGLCHGRIEEVGKHKMNPGIQPRGIAPLAVNRNLATRTAESKQEAAEK
jgi:hypothetical protein